MARYNVIDRETAATFGIKSNGEYNHHVLVAMNNDVPTDVVCWGYKRENLQAIADKRNGEMEMTRRALIKGEPADPLIGVI